MPFLGTTPTQGFVGANPKQSFTANGSTTVFTLTNPVASANDLEVFVGNVRQEPTAAYSAAGTTLTMTEAPDTGLNFYVINKSQAQVTTTPPDGSVGTGKITNSAVTDAKLATGITATKLTGTVSNARFPAGTVVQVVTSVASDQSVGLFSTTNSTPQATGHSVTITPQYSDSDILIQLHTIGGQLTVGRSYKLHMYKSVGGATATLATAFNIGDDSDGTLKTQIGQIFLDDSVGNTSARVYSTRCGTDGVGTSVYNYQNGQSGDSHSVLMAMEIKR